MSEPNPARDPGTIRSYHAHVYYDASTREVAEALRAEIVARFPVEIGRMHDQPIGPHPQPMFEAAFAIAELPNIVPWLMLNRSGLTILVHPNTDDAVLDHTTHPLWLGTPVALDAEFIRRYVESKRAAAASASAA